MNYESATFENDGRLALPGSGAPRSNLIWWIVGAVVVLLLAVAAWFAFGFGKKPEEKHVEQLPNVTVMIPGTTLVPRVLSATGSLAARREMPVGVAGEGGMVTRVLVEPGQWVGAGQVLATVDRSVQTQTAASLAAQISVARSDAAIAQSELNRAQQLVNRGFISKADLERKAATRDAALARVRVAQATLSEQNARTGRLDIRAPAAGLVLTRSVEPGQIVSSGSGVLFRMAKGGEMEMLAALSETDLAGLGVGVRAKVTPVGGKESFAGEVWQVSPIIDPQTRQGTARIALTYNPALRPGGFAAAEITSGAATSPQLPESAVLSDDRGNFVYVIGQDDKVVRRDVKVGAVSDSGVAVASGLAGTERVVVSAGAFLNPGQKVTPIVAKSAAKTGS
ncbi:efflux RND transporter periplasmic adaptor subunit [Sphingomonas sp. So64.6b]|uniref:efflux RND transporter periplasmic adaptor subunit n=1 Tax=Sphingomonas sp. So64.6b TaxID=2997354 RepID=UPI001601CF95|nr:efflux RND transporter periplasmic adaptor subunit [Sphingomonas sp. So64.6b]QNA85552.1 efflux RND transporter periplasmic adaptor subunit [Sphingomonas sp. So64.6b]